MTALKPIENRAVRAVASETYPSNLVCAHPECTEKVDLRPNGEPTVHHIFPRSMVKSDSYFVQIEALKYEELVPLAGDTRTSAGPHKTGDIYGVGDETAIRLHRVILPHAVGLCGSGTTGHHGDVEEHRAWIKLEDGVFVWYRKIPLVGPRDAWERVGPLNPQPGSRDGKPKRRRKASTPEERKARVNHTIRTPKDEENVLPELIQAGRDAWADELGWTESVPDYYVVTAAFAKALL